ncbi:MAG: hypothetical protein ABEJ30_03100 [Halorientalis sp.]
MDDGDDEWRFSLSDVGPDEDDVRAGDDEAVAADDTRGNVAGTLGLSESLEPGEPTAENALFVLLGALTTAVLFLSLVGAL